MFSIGEAVKFIEDGATGTVIGKGEKGYLICWEDRVMSWATAEQIVHIKATFDWKERYLNWISSKG